MSLISREAAIDAIRASASKYMGFMEMEMYTDGDAVEAINNLPSAQPTLYGYKIEHLALIARVMEKEGVTPGEVAGLLRDVGKISEMVVDVVQKAHKKFIREAVCRVDDDPSHPFADGVMMKE